MTERWLPAPGYEGSYEVSDQGRVRSCDRVVARAGHTMTLAGRALSPCTDRHGYQHVNLCQGGLCRLNKVHQLVLRTFVGPPVPGHISRHGSGGPGDNRLVNLRWGTHSDNRYDSVRDGTHALASRTHCPRRHPLASPNLRNSKHRNCRACHRAQAAISYARRCGRPIPDLQQLSDSYFVEIMKGSS